MTTWVQQGGSGQAYAEWEALQAGDAADDQTVPLFLAFSMADAANDAAARAGLDALRSAGLTPAPHEGDRLLTEFLAVLGAGKLKDWTFRLVAFARRGDIPKIQADLPFLDILHIGAPMLPDAAAGLSPRPAVAHLPAAKKLQAPIAAVIDDGIPFLSARLRRSVSETRLLSVWLQADKSVADPGAEVMGRILTKAEIDPLIARNDERQVYAQVNRDLVPITERASTDFRISHGAHVMDIAAGADFDEDMAKTRLLAVQLPSAAVADTSGRRNGRYVVQGLRWSMMETLKANEAKGAGPLVVNLSIGSLAGPGDDTGFLASWLDYEAKAYKLITGCDLRLVCAYGNSHRDKLAARDVVKPGRPMQLDWCVLPEDFTASFLEVRVAEAEAKSLSLSFTCPKGGAAPFDMAWSEAEKGWICPGPDGRPIAAVLPLDEAKGDGRTRALLVATAATERRRGGPAAPSGAWKITIEGGPAMVTALVQRDDTPAGYRPFGRQSWLDSATAYLWDFQTRDWIKPWSLDPTDSGLVQAGERPVSRLGTAVAHAGATADTITFVGSIKPIIGFPDRRVSTLYSAEGIPADTNINGSSARRPGESEGPDLAALADDGSNLYGRLGSGVISGSTTRLSGTSVAAPAVTRRYLMEYSVQAASGATIPPPAIPLADLLREAPWPDRHPIEGFGALKGQRQYTQGSEMTP